MTRENVREMFSQGWSARTKAQERVPPLACDMSLAPDPMLNFCCKNVPFSTLRREATVLHFVPIKSRAELRARHDPAQVVFL